MESEDISALASKLTGLILDACDTKGEAMVVGHMISDNLLVAAVTGFLKKEGVESDGEAVGIEG